MGNGGSQMKVSNGCDISFVIPTYNAEKYIEPCLDSITCQADVAKEIIVIDDGSTDRTAELVEKYKMKYKDITFYKREHNGVSAARNLGIEKANGTWICFVDSDDYLEKNSIALILNNIPEDMDVLYADYAKIKQGKQKLIHYSDITVDFDQADFELFQRATLNKNYNPDNLHIVVPWAKLYRTEFLKKNQIRYTVGVRKSQDLLFNFEVYHYARKGRYVPYLMYFYRYNADSVCKKYMPGILEDYLRQIRKINGLLMSYGRYELLENDFHYRCAVAFMVSLRLDYVHRDNDKKYRQRKQEFEDALDIEVINKAVYSVDESNFSFVERILLKNVKKKRFRIIQFLNGGYSFIEKLMWVNI